MNRERRWIITIECDNGMMQLIAALLHQQHIENNPLHPITLTEITRPTKPSSRKDGVK